jgi:hypothetical protein
MRAGLRQRMHRDWDAAFGEQSRIPRVVFVIVREHRTGDASLVEKSSERATHERKPTVDEDAVDEVGAHVHASDPAAPTREPDSLHVAEALNFDHSTS